MTVIATIEGADQSLISALPDQPHTMGLNLLGSPATTGRLMTLTDDS